MADKNIYTVIVADDEDELREAVCTMIPWEALGFQPRWQRQQRPGRAGTRRAAGTPTCC